MKTVEKHVPACDIDHTMRIHTYLGLTAHSRKQRRRLPDRDRTPLTMTGIATTELQQRRRRNDTTSATTVATATKTAAPSAAVTRRGRHQPVSESSTDGWSAPGNEGARTLHWRLHTPSSLLIAVVLHLTAPPASPLPQTSRRHLRPIRATAGESVLALMRVPWT